MKNLYNIWYIHRYENITIIKQFQPQNNNVMNLDFKWTRLDWDVFHVGMFFPYQES